MMMRQHVEWSLRHDAKLFVYVDKKVILNCQRMISPLNLIKNYVLKPGTSGKCRFYTAWISLCYVVRHYFVFMNVSVQSGLAREFSGLQRIQAYSPRFLVVYLSTNKSGEVRNRTEKYGRVRKSTEKNGKERKSRVSTEKYGKVRKSTEKYGKVSIVLR